LKLNLKVTLVVLRSKQMLPYDRRGL